MTKQRRSFTLEFKREAPDLVLRQNNSYIEASCAPHNAALVSHAESLTLQHQQTDFFPSPAMDGTICFGSSKITRRCRKSTFPTFYLEDGVAAQMSVVFRLPVDDELNIPMTDGELAFVLTPAGHSNKAVPWPGRSTSRGSSGCSR
nr:transposase [uncultured Pseudomonas sp.]